MFGNHNVIRCTKCFSDKLNILSQNFTEHNISEALVCKDCGTIIEVNYKIVIDCVEEITE